MDKSTVTSGILQYIPLFYVIWSDGLLSASEVSVTTKAILDDTSLEEYDREKLLAWLVLENPPKDDELKSWQSIISESKVTLIESETYPLAAFSQKVVCHFFKDCPLNNQLKSIEVNLGIQPNHYHHLFNVEVIKATSSDYYEATVIDEILKGPNAIIIDDFRKSLDHPIFESKIIRNKEDHRNRVLDQVKCLAEKGYGAMAYPSEYGGTENMEAYATIFENMMFVDGSLAIKFGVQFGLFGGSIQKLGTKTHHETYLKATGEAKILGCFAMTETGHGSNVRGIKTTATYNPKNDTIIVHTPGKDDNKEYIGNAIHAEVASVFAQLIVNGKNEGVHALLVPIRNKETSKTLAGVTVKDNGYKLGLNGVDNGKIWFHQVAVPRQNLLNKYGEIKDDGSYYSAIKNPNKRFFTMLGTLVGGRICVARAGLGGAKMALTIAVKHALTRRQFNNSIKMQEDLLMDYPSHQLRLTPLIASAYVYHCTLDKMMKYYCDDSQQDKRQIETQVAGLKSIITLYANTTIQECREACGGKGYLLENRIGDLKNDVDIFTTFEGDNNVLLQLAAKGVLSDFKAEFSSDSFVSVLKLLGQQLNDKLQTFNPIYANKIEKDHLNNPKFHLHALQYRTRRLTYTLALRIRGYIKKGIPSYQAFLKVQTHLLELGTAYSVELSYKTYLESIKEISEEKYSTLFQNIGTLYALHEIKKQRFWYLEQGYINGNKSKAIRNYTERLCSELRPHIGVLVDGFGIPKHCLSAPIAKR